MTTTKEVVNGQDMCELISKFWASKGIHKTWEEIWNYSPTGELFEVFFWYEEAKEWNLNEKQLKRNKD